LRHNAGRVYRIVDGARGMSGRPCGDPGQEELRFVPYAGALGAVTQARVGTTSHDDLRFVVEILLDARFECLPRNVEGGRDRERNAEAFTPRTHSHVVGSRLIPSQTHTTHVLAPAPVPSPPWRRLNLIKEPSEVIVRAQHTYTCIDAMSLAAW
jgi:hypothetical protein